MRKLSVILPAAGRSTRFGERGVKKQFAMLDGRPLWVHAAERFVNRENVVQTNLGHCRGGCRGFSPEIRQHGALMGVEISYRRPGAMPPPWNRGLARVREDVDLVCIHDAARPCSRPAGLTG